MFENFVNPMMLLGLAGISLPLLVHLLSRKRFDVVYWGAMQFLELGRNTRRKLRLEELLLMLLRMAMIVLLALAVARPFARLEFLSGLADRQNRDIVLVIDGSYSMGWEGKAVTPHGAAIGWTHRFLEHLKPGDTVCLFDARDQLRPVIESPTSDLSWVRQELNELPAPSGTAQLAQATAKAIQLLSQTNNMSRQVIVLTDSQARGWSADDVNVWTRFDDLCQQPAVRPQVYVVDVAGVGSAERVNFNVDRPQLSRELTVEGFPIRIKSKIKYSGGQTPSTRRVYFEVDGQRLAEQTLTVQLQPEGEATVEFEHRFASVGSHVISMVLDDDNLPADNRADAAVVVTDALPVLLVDGDPQLDDTQSETFYARAALTSPNNDVPWIRASVIDWEHFDDADLGVTEVIVLANVPSFNEKQAQRLRHFVSRGGGLFIVLGDKVNTASYNQWLFDSSRGPLPGSIETLKEDRSQESRGARVADTSLELPWMTRFRSDHGGGFADARFSHWWKTVLPHAPQADTPDINQVAEQSVTPHDGEPLQVQQSLTVARFENGQPLLLMKRYDRGNVLLMTSAIDADWSTLPAKPDFVSFLHEMVFYLSSGKSERNVDVGMPLILPVRSDFPIDAYEFIRPDKKPMPVQLGGNETRQLLRSNETSLPGVYSLRPKDDPFGGIYSANRALFVVNFDRGESDLTLLTEAQRQSLLDGGRMKFIETAEELETLSLKDTPPTELWYVLLFVFLSLLVGEVLLTRRLVEGGHAIVEEDQNRHDRE